MDETEAKTPPPPESEWASLQQSLAEATTKAEEYLAGWQRSQADFQNLKRRTEQEKEEVKRFANAMLILNLLQVLDDFERAFNSISSHLAGLTWIQGITLIYRKLQGILESQGLQEIRAAGQPFDHTFHEVVAHGEGEEGVVLEEVQKGYMLHDRVIRPTLVVVGKNKAKPAESPESVKQEGS